MFDRHSASVQFVLGRMIAAKNSATTPVVSEHSSDSSDEEFHTNRIARNLSIPDALKDKLVNRDQLAARVEQHRADIHRLGGARRGERKQVSPESASVPCGEESTNEDFEALIKDRELIESETSSQVKEHLERQECEREGVDHCDDSELKKDNDEDFGQNKVSTNKRPTASADFDYIRNLRQSGKIKDKASPINALSTSSSSTFSRPRGSRGSVVTPCLQYASIHACEAVTLASKKNDSDDDDKNDDDIDALAGDSDGDLMDGAEERVFCSFPVNDAVDPSAHIPEGLLVPDNITVAEFSANILPHMTESRPYFKADLYGIIPDVHMLIDSGSSLNTIHIDLYTKAVDELARYGMELPNVPSDYSVRCFGGSVIEHNACSLLAFRATTGHTFNNLPCLIIDDPEASQGILLGMPFITQFNCQIDVYTDPESGEDECIVRFGPERDVEIKAELIGRVHKVEAVNETEIMPHASAKVKMNFPNIPNMASNLDGQNFLFDGDWLTDYLGGDQSQVVTPKNGVFEVRLTNYHDVSKLISPGVEITSVENLQQITESLEIGVQMRQHINSVALSKLARVSCLCADFLGDDAAILVPLEKGNLSLLGPYLELLNPAEINPRWNKRRPRDEFWGPRTLIRGRYIYILPPPEGATKDEARLQSEDFDNIKHMRPPKDWWICAPFHPGRCVYLPHLQDILDLRNLGYRVDTPSFTPKEEDPYRPVITKERGICDKCLQGSLDDVLSPSEKYKLTDVLLILPSTRGGFPGEFQRKIEHSSIGLFKLYSWNIVYYQLDANTLVVVPHVPREQVGNPTLMTGHFCILFGYLKPQVPKAKIKILGYMGGLRPQETASGATVLPDGDDASHPWSKPVLEAWNTSHVFKDFFDIGFGRPRKSRREPKTEEFSVCRFLYSKTDTFCNCLFCDNGSDFADRLLSPHTTIVYGNWPLSPERVQHLKAITKEINRERSEMASKRTLSDQKIGEPESVNSLHGFSRNSVLDSSMNALGLYGSIERAELIMELFHLQKGDAEVSELQCMHGDQNDVIPLKSEPMFKSSLEWGENPHSYDLKKPISPEEMEQLIDLEHLTADQRPYVLEILNRWESCLSADKEDIRIIKNHCLSFTVNDHTPYYIKPYPLSQGLTQVYMNHFKNLQRKGFAIPDTIYSRPKILFFSPSFLVWRNSEARIARNLDQLRLVTDFSLLNSRIVEPDAGENIEQIQSIFSRFCGASYVSILDVHNFFPSFMLNKDTQRFMGLSTPQGESDWRCRTAALGVRTWPGATALASACCFRPEIKSRVVQYIDDFALISAKERFPLTTEYLKLVGTGEGLTADFFSHCRMFNNFLEDADNFGLLFSVKKMKIFRLNFSYLGYEVGEGGTLSIPTEKLKVLDEFDFESCTPKILQGILGFCNYWSQFIDSYADYASLLHHLINWKPPAGQRWKLSSTHIRLLKELFAEIKQAPKIYLWDPSPDVQTEIYCDASFFAQACVIMQIQNGRRVLIRFASWKIPETEMRSLASCLKEASTLIKVLRSFPQYFQNTKNPTIIYTDQKVVSELLFNSRRAAPDSKLSRWLLIISNLPLVFRCHYRPGISDHLRVADFLSRDPRLAPNYECRFSNRTRHLAPKDRPKFSGDLTTEEIREHIRQFDLLKWPLRSSRRTPVQDRIRDYASDDYYEKIGISHWLPNLSWPVPPRARLKHYPPSVDSQDTASLVSQTDAFSIPGSLGKSSVICDQPPHCENDSAPPLLSARSSAQSCAALSESPRDRDSDSADEEAEERDETVFSNHMLDGSDILSNMMINVASVYHPDPEAVVQFRHSLLKGNVLPYTNEELLSNQLKEKDLHDIIMALASDSADPEVKDRYALFQGGILTRLEAINPDSPEGSEEQQARYKIVLDFYSCLLVCAWLHLYSHSGQDSHLKMMTQIYTSNHSMTNIMKAVVSSCAACLWMRRSNNYKRDVADGGVSYRINQIWRYLVIDHCQMRTPIYKGPTGEKLRLPYTHILQVYDPSSRLSLPTATTGVSQKETAKLLDRILSYIPKVEVICSDNATGLLRSSAVRKILLRHGIRRRLTLPSHSQSNALVENSIKQLRRLLRINMRFLNTNDWVSVLPIVTRQLNHNFRRFYFLDSFNRVKSLWTSPINLAYGVSLRLTNREMFGDSFAEVSQPQRLAWRKQISSAIEKFNLSKLAISQERDRAFRVKAKIVPGTLVLLRNHGRYEKSEAARRPNIYTVVSRDDKRMTLSPMFGLDPDEKKPLITRYVGDGIPFAQNELLQYLPREFQEGLGVIRPLKPAKEIPWQLLGDPQQIIAEKKFLQRILQQVTKAGKQRKLLKEPTVNSGSGDESDDDDGNSSVATISVARDSESNIDLPLLPASKSAHKSSGGLPAQKIGRPQARPARGTITDGFDGEEEEQRPRRRPVAPAPDPPPLPPRPPRHHRHVEQSRQNQWVKRLREKLRKTSKK